MYGKKVIPINHLTLEQTFLKEVLAVNGYYDNVISPVRPEQTLRNKVTEDSSVVCLMGGPNGVDWGKITALAA